MNHLLTSALVFVVFTSPLQADDWPQWLGPKRDGVWRETGILAKFPPSGPKVVWKQPVSLGYAGPAIAAGKVYVPDWIEGQGGSKAKTAFQRGDQPGRERLHCLDQATGKPLWTDEYDSTYRVSYSAGPRATPSIDGNRVYTVGTMGHLRCLDTETGKLIWQRHYVDEFKADVPIWGFSSPPLVDGEQLICLVGGEGSLVMSFDKATGKERWRALSDQEPGYAPPMIYDVSGSRQLIVWHPAAVTALDPATGKTLWNQPFQLKAGLSIPTPRLLPDNRLFVTAFYNGSLMLDLSKPPTASVAWKVGGKNERAENTQALHSIMVTPFVVDGFIYGIDSYGEMRCLDARNGERVWSSMEATGPKPERWGNAFLVQQGERFFLFNEHGELIIARLTPKGYEEISRAKVIEPTNRLAGRPVVWTYPAFAGRCAFIRNDKEVICLSLAE